MLRRATFGILLLALAGACTPRLVLVPTELTFARGVEHAARIDVERAGTPVGGVSVVDSSLPPGLRLEHTERERFLTIAGTPQKAGDFTFTLNVWCYGTNFAGQTLTQEIRVRVRP